MKYKLIVPVILALLVSSVVIAVQGVPQDPQQDFQAKSSDFMRKKLSASRDIVEGLATEDYQQIAQNAQDLMLLSQESGWNIIQSDEYLRMSSEFRNSAERLRDNAKDKSLDGATLAYFEVTLSCVRCHKYIRQRTDSK